MEYPNNLIPRDAPYLETVGSQMSRRKMLLSATAAFAFATPAIAAQTDKVVCAHYPPLMIGLGARTGSSVEILQEAARILGRNLDIEFLPFRRALRTLQHKPDYLQPALYRNPTREPDYTWVAQTHTVLNVFNSIHGRIDTLDEARRLARIGVETDAAMDVLLTRLGFENLVRVDKPAVTAEQLRKGHIDAWALTRSLALWTWNLLGYQEPLLHGAPVETADVYLVASKSVSSMMVAEYSETVQALKTDGFIDKVLSDYAGVMK